MRSDEFEELLAETQAAGIRRVVVGGVIVRNGKALLLQRREDDYLGGIFEIPSGEVEEGETLLQALEREVLEETGLAIAQVSGYLGAFDYPSRSGQQTRQLSFQVNVYPSAVVLGEHDVHVWTGKADLDAYPLSDQTRELVRRAFVHCEVSQPGNMSASQVGVIETKSTRPKNRNA